MTALQSLNAVLERLASALPQGSLLTDPASLERHLVEERGKFHGKARAVLAPASTEELARAVAICAEAGVALVPQGGNTGLVGGAVSAEGEIVVSLHRMNRILAVDPVNFTMTVEAGVILASIQETARDAGCLFPLSLGAEGSCTIGGNIASNAGGVGVLKYGNTRELVLGLEVVLPDGRIWNGMRPVLKDNTGYSLKNLFIGSEGTLGIVTRAVLKLFPAPQQKQTAFCALNSVADALALLSLARKSSGDAVTAFELMSRFSLDLLEKHLGLPALIEGAYPWYALIELSTSRPGTDLREEFEAMLGEAIEQGLVQDAVLPESLDQAARLWRMRESIPEAQKHAGGSIKHDIAVPVSCIPDFIDRAGAAVLARLPGTRICAFGHVGDGNVHYNLTQPEDMDKAEFLALWDEMNAIVHAIAAGLNGSISAEHGIGLLKVEEVEHFRSAEEHDLMLAIKRAIDPAGIMNPGKLIAERPAR